MDDVLFLHVQVCKHTSNKAPAGIVHSTTQPQVGRR